MILKDILAISGQPGLFRYIAQGKNAIVVEHIETGKRTSASGSAKVSALEDIAIFTSTEDIPLSKVFDLINEKAGESPAVDPRADNKVIKAWFEEILPDYSREKVYVSDMKKVAQWYNLLLKHNMLKKESPVSEADGQVNDGTQEAGEQAGE